MAHCLDDSMEFRSDAKKLDLTADYSDKRPVGMTFDLNMGEIRTPTKDPAKIMKLVKLARMYAEGPGYGEHNALLNLVALRSELNQPRVYWHRPYHVDAGRNPERWISLHDWLKENGQNPDTVLARV